MSCRLVRRRYFGRIERPRRQPGRERLQLGFDLAEATRQPVSLVPQGAGQRHNRLDQKSLALVDRQTVILDLTGVRGFRPPRLLPHEPLAEQEGCPVSNL